MLLLFAVGRLILLWGSLLAGVFCWRLPLTPKKLLLLLFAARLLVVAAVDVDAVVAAGCYCGLLLLLFAVRLLLLGSLSF